MAVGHHVWSNARAGGVTSEEGKAWEKDVFQLLALELLVSPIPDMGLLRECGSGFTSAILAAAGAGWPPSPLYLPEGQRMLNDDKGLW